MTLRLVAFNFFERGLKNINFHFCYAQSLSDLNKLPFITAYFSSTTTPRWMWVKLGREDWAVHLIVKVYTNITERPADI